MSDFTIKVREEGDITILETSGYLNNFGGDRVASICKQSISEGKRKLLINLENTKMVNSIGVSILIEIIEDLQGVNGKIAYYNVAPIVEKTFNIMGITNYSKIYTSEEDAIKAFS
ncbi:MAG: STAS domain-containing protein [Candidatus Neomarinimicrobiota bacterium]|jgi:anti-anti-sigma factor|nr:STAS domain-containing protein [Candidatus Neomarinimicrobiota bacterium]|tara:strand:+ start:296 stop:640 length:345 start_codon:yes stop_codon:yes gene_type:complete